MTLVVAPVLPPATTAIEPPSMVDKATGLPSVLMSQCLAQLAQSLWNFPCAVQLRYSWSTNDTAAIVRAASDAAASAATARDPINEAVRAV